jgi:hypothetical protein
MTVVANSAIYEGRTTHVRRKPFEHRLQYGLFSLLVDLDELDELGRMPFFSHNQTNLISFFDRDHGPRNGEDLRAWITAKLETAGFEGRLGRIRLLCLPRIAGYEFNPLTVWFIDDAAGDPRWILYEIHNTFGEAHSHLVEVDPGDRHEHGFRKEFFVSPFFDVEGGYHVRISQPAERISIAITYEVDGETVFTAGLTGRRLPLTSRTLIVATIRYPLVTLKVMAAIHWEAAKLWFKGARYRKRPQAPVEEVSVSTRMAA